MSYTFSKILSFKKEINQWLELFEACFGKRSNLNKEWYYWYNTLYRDNNIFIVKDKNKIIASYGLYPLNLNFKNTPKQGYLCHNVMTHPEYAGQGLFTKLGKYAISNVSKDSILIGIPNSNAIKGHYKVGWQEMPNINFYTKTSFKNYNHNFTPIDKFYKKDNEKINNFLSKYNFSLKKNSNYLNWRYSTRPYIKYKIYKSNPFTSYVVLKHFIEENKLHIVDYGYDTDNDFINIIKFSESLAFKLKVNILNLWNINTKEQKTLLKYSFFKDSNFNKFILYNNNIKFNNENLDNWCINLGDNDVY
tara:strand:- start:1072 stop:1986 length:915 start_codon:yes stop_codon:yes gene_type:complete